MNAVVAAPAANANDAVVPHPLPPAKRVRKNASPRSAAPAAPTPDAIADMMGKIAEVKTGG